MGHWRLAFVFPFARELGYRYLWQTDDDAYLHEPVGFNVLAHMENKSLVIAANKIVGAYIT